MSMHLAKGFERILVFFKRPKKPAVGFLLLTKEPHFIEDQGPGGDGEDQKNHKNNLRNETERGQQLKKSGTKHHALCEILPNIQTLRLHRHRSRSPRREKIGGADGI